MNKKEETVKPLFFEENTTNFDGTVLELIKEKFQRNSEARAFYNQKLTEF